MNLRKNNGITTIDFSVAIMILLVTIPVMFGIAYNFLKDDNYAIREATAVRVATEVIEMAKSTNFDEITLNDESSFIRRFK